MHDHVGNLGALLADPLLDLASPTVRVSERRPGIEAEGYEGDQALVGLEKTKLAGLGSRGVADDLLDEARIALNSGAPGRLGERLQVRLHGDDLRQRFGDR